MSEEIKWHARVREMPHVEGFDYPIFEWSYGGDLLRGGEIRAWSLQRMFSHVNRREGGEHTSDAEGALEFAERMGWPSPPQFTEVLAAMASVPTYHNLEEAKAGFADLKQKWEELT